MSTRPPDRTARDMACPVDSEANRAVRVPCFECGAMVRLTDAVFDLRGPAFRAYYCADCAATECPHVDVPVLDGRSRRESSL